MFILYNCTLHVGIHILIFILAHLAKGNVGFWHHLTSVVCCLSSVNFSHFNLLLWSLVGSIYGRSSLKSAHFVIIHYQSWPSTDNSCFWLANFLNLLLWNRLAKLTETWHEASMECPLWRLLISSRSVNKHGHHRQFLFLIGRYLKNLLLWNCLAKWTETW